MSPKTFGFSFYCSLGFYRLYKFEDGQKYKILIATVSKMFERSVFDGNSKKIERQGKKNQIEQDRKLIKKILSQFSPKNTRRYREAMKHDLKNKLEQSKGKVVKDEITIYCCICVIWSIRKYLIKLQMNG